jgi:hypothetical protein
MLASINVLAKTSSKAYPKIGKCSAKPQSTMSTKQREASEAAASMSGD